MLIAIGVEVILETFYLEDGNHIHNIKIRKEKEIMPCDTITTVKLELKNANLVSLKRAIEVVLKDRAYVMIRDNGLTFTGGAYSKSTGVLTIRDTKIGENIKRAYSGELVKEQAKRFGWQVKQTADFKYQIIKR